MKFKAAILVESCRPLVVDEIENEPLLPGQVLVRVQCSGICGAQINEIDAVKGPDKFLPHLLGHEGGGTVVEVGPAVQHVKVGDRVVMHWRKGQGIHAPTASYRWNGRKVNSGWVTTFSEYSVVSENRVTPIPKDVPFEVAALLGCAVTSGAGIVNNDAGVKLGESVVVFGVGGLGLAVVQAARLAGAQPIIAVDLIDQKLEWARDLGATHVVKAGPGVDVEKAIRNIVGAAGADVCVENTGNVRVIESAYALTRDRVGRCILAGVPRHDEKVSIHTLPLHFGKVLTGSEGGETNPTEDIPRYIRLYGAGRLDIKALISHRMSLEKVNDGINLLRQGLPKRVLLDMPE